MVLKIKKRLILISIIIAIIIFNIFFGNSIVTVYIEDTIYATTYFALTIFLAAVILLVWMIMSIVKKFRTRKTNF